MQRPETRHDRAWELAEGSYADAAIVRAIIAKFVERIVQNDDRGVEIDDYAKVVEAIRHQAQQEIDEVLSQQTTATDQMEYKTVA